MLLAVTLIGNPERALTDNDVEMASGAARKVGGSINGKEWLFPSEACDLFVEGDAVLTRDAITPWSIENKLDVIVQSYQGRRKKAFLADMESTIIENEMLDELAAKVGIGEQVALITRRSMEGEIDFKAALIERLALLKDVPYSVVQELIVNIRYMPGAKELIATLKKQNVRTVLVSGGFTVFTDIVAKKLRFDENYGNNLSIRDMRLTGLPIDPILGPEAKLARLKATAKLQGISEEDICAIGDGANDIPMIMAAGLGIAYHGKPKVVEKAAFSIRFANLRAVLWALGYRKEDLA
jgi:phosphoserine phosphatase